MAAGFWPLAAAAAVCRVPPATPRNRQAEMDPAENFGAPLLD
jgi:hypothetical protein